MAKKSIQDAQKSQKKQYDKSSHPVTIKARDTVFVKVQPKFKPIMGLIECMKLLTLMLKLNQLVLQMLNLRLFHYNKSQNAREAFQQINFGVVIILLTLESKGKFRRNRMLDLELSGQPACGQPDVASQTTIPVYRTRYGRAVKNHPSDFFKGGGDEELELKT